MRKNNLLNKSISVMLIFFLLSTNTVLSASSLNDLLLKNDTYAGTWEDPSSGINYMSGGGIKIKFKGGSTPIVPWVQGKMPSAKVGCNGISIEGGFLALLGLEDIENQLKDAGAALAWGILIGLAYSLPAISNVFQQIQKWARAIQALLQNACKIGEAIVRSSQASKDLTNTLQNNAITKGFDKAKSWLDSTAEKVESLNTFVECSGDAACIKKRDGQISTWFKEFLNFSLTDWVAKMGVGGVGTALKDVELSSSKNKAYYKEHKLSEVLDSNSTSGFTISEDQELSIKLTLLFFGDIAATQESAAIISSYFNSSGELDEDKVKAKGEELIKEGGSLGEIKYKIISPKYNNTKEVVDILMNGSKEKMYINDYTLAVYQGLGKGEKGGSTDKNTITTTFLVDKSEVSTNENLSLTWGGFFEESRNQIVKMINSTPDSNVTETLFTTDTAGTYSIGSDYTPVLLPQLESYVQKLKKAYKTNPQLKLSVLEAINKMAQINAALATIALVDEISDRVRKMALSSDEQEATFIAFLESLEKKRTEVIKEVKKSYSTDEDISMNLFKLIEDIERESKKGTLR